MLNEAKVREMLSYLKKERELRLEVLQEWEKMAPIGLKSAAHCRRSFLEMCRQIELVEAILNGDGDTECWEK